MLKLRQATINFCGCVRRDDHALMQKMPTTLPITEDTAMARLFATLLLSLAFSGSLHADILMRIPSLPAGDSTLAGYEGWIKIDRIEFSIDRDPPPQGGGGTEDINIGMGRINLFHLSKPTDAVSTDLFRFAIIGNSIGAVDLRVVDVCPGCVVPTEAWKFDRTFVASYSTKSVGNELVDEFSLYFNYIAFATVEEDGVSAFGWNKVQNTAWTDHGLETALQNELNAAQCATPGDFNIDGIVDGADFLTWQRGESPHPLSESDLADLEGHLGAGPALSDAATPIPEPAASMLVILAAVGILRIKPRGAPKSRYMPHL
jgi:type VI protein secretion system component Hcp